MTKANFQPQSSICGPVVIFAPHPDDEVIACGGTIIKRVAQGCPVHIVFSTDGSRSHQAVLGIDSDPTPEELINIRIGEATAAAAVLGVPKENLTFIGARDTRLVDSLGLFRKRVDEILRRIGPVAIYCPHETKELNADHSLTGQLVLERARAMNLEVDIFRYVVWSDEVEEAFGYSNRLTSLAAPKGIEVAYREDIRAEREQKFAAMLEHKTQTTLFSRAQDRTVVPPILMELVRTRSYEEFWRLS